MSQQNMFIHLVAGGLAGATGSVITCPLEVVKTRLQSSTSSFQNVLLASSKSPSTTANGSHLNNRIKLAHKLQSCSFNTNILFKNNHLNHHHTSVMSSSYNFDSHLVNHHQNSKFSINNLNNLSVMKQPKPGAGIYLYFKTIVKNEGYRALFKGLGPNLLGVAPYRAIYFFSYANSKVFLTRFISEERPLLHVCSAFIAGFSAVTVTNPIWFVKTRLQLDETRRGLSTLEVVQKILREKGPLGFYKGISASYFGIGESAICFAIYERLKTISNRQINDDSTYVKFLSYFTSAGFSKTLASCLFYPHEVARTRLREEGNKYTGFFQTLALVVREEGIRGLYKGMATHMVRQIPNTAIVLTTYELIVNYFKIVDNPCGVETEEN